MAGLAETIRRFGGTQNLELVQALDVPVWDSSFQFGAPQARIWVSFGRFPTMPIQFGDFTSFVDRIKYVNLVGTDLVDQAKKWNILFQPNCHTLLHFLRKHAACFEHKGIWKKHDTTGKWSSENRKLIEKTCMITVSTTQGFILCTPNVSTRL